MDIRSRLSWRFLTVPIGVWLIIIGARFLILGFMVVGTKLVPPAQIEGSWMVEPGHPFRDKLANFDGAWFIRVAALGYKKLQTGDYDLEAEKTRLRVMDKRGYEEGKLSFGYRHFPLFPYTMRIVRIFIADWTLCGIFTANFFSLLYLIFLFKYAEFEMGEKVAWWAVTFATLSPNAHYYLAIYSEGLLMSMFVASVYFARRDRWNLAALFGILSSASRMEGSFIFFCLFLVLVEKMGGIKNAVRDKRLIYVFLAPAGVLFPILEFWRQSGSLFAPYIAMKKALGATAMWPWQAFRIDFTHANFITLGVDVPSLIAMVVLIIAMYWVVPRYLARFMTIGALARLMQPHFGLVRFMIGFFGFHMLFGAIATKRPLLSSFILGFFAIILAFFAILFATGYWVA